LQGRKLLWPATCLRQPGMICLHRAFFFEPRKSLLQNLRGSYIRRHDDPIVHPFPVPASSYNPCVPQVCKVPGYLGLRLIQNLNEIADANFLISHEIQEPQARIVAQSLEEALHVEALILDLHEMNYICIDECVYCKYSRLSAYVKRGKNDRPIA
jgi:hypothetical protein